MFAVNTYEEIEKRELELNEKHIVVLLFVRPTANTSEIIAEFDYIHYNSDKYCSFYAVGYTNSNDVDSSYASIQGVNNELWKFSIEKFTEFKNKLEQRINWTYGGDVELIILQTNPEGKQILNFSNYLTIDINRGIKKNYILSFNNFTESLIRCSKKEVTVSNLSSRMSNSKIKMKSIFEETLLENEKIPHPIKTILKDRLFYKTSKSYPNRK